VSNVDRPTPFGSEKKCGMHISVKCVVRVKAMLLAQCKLFYVKEFLITDYSKEFCNATVYWENSYISRGTLYKALL
jgi:hypothetical protein